MCGFVELELSKVHLVLSESHNPSPKTKALRTATVRRRKRPLTHMRQQHLDKALSPVTTPEDEKRVIHRIKHVAGATLAKSLLVPGHYCCFCVIDYNVCAAAGSTQTRHIPDHRSEGLALYSVSKLLLIISSVSIRSEKPNHRTYFLHTFSNELLILENNV